MQPLEVPAIQIQRVPVDEEQRDVISLALIHFGVQHDTVRSDDVGPSARTRRTPPSTSDLASESLRYDPALEFDA